MAGLSDDLCLAAKMGDVATVQAWLEAGGNPDERMARSDATDTNMRGHEIGQTLLHYAVGGPNVSVASDPNLLADLERRRTNIVRMLLAHGATVDAVPDGACNNTPLFVAALYGQAESVEQLCLAGANVNHTRSTGDFPLWYATRKCPSTVRVLLRFGADPSMTYIDGGRQRTPEEHANLHSESYFGSIYRESARILADARLLRPRLRQIFALRALVHRGRATPTSETPEGFALLFFAPTSRPRTRAAWRRSPPGLHEPLDHLVCSFWLCEPPRRRTV